jgi:tRNA (guanine-N7-)-methyltransferase
MSDLPSTKLDFRPAKRGRSQVRGRGADYVARSSRFEVDAAQLDAWRPDIVEVGFGTGDSVLAVAAERPDARILAVDIYERGAARLIRVLAEAGLTNVRVSSQDARTVLGLIPPGTVSEVRTFFPDPWPKRKHRERRMIQADFVARVEQVLRPGGIFWLATDSPDYAAQVRALCAAVPDFPELAEPVHRPSTKYARRAEELGGLCVDLVWQRTG